MFLPGVPKLSTSTVHMENMLTLLRGAEPLQTKLMATAPTSGPARSVSMHWIGFKLSVKHLTDLIWVIKCMFWRLIKSFGTHREVILNSSRAEGPTRTQMAKCIINYPRLSSTFEHWSNNVISVNKVIQHNIINTKAAFKLNYIYKQLYGKIRARIKRKFTPLLFASDTVYNWTTS